MVITFLRHHSFLSFGLLFFYQFHISYNYTLLPTVTEPTSNPNPGLITSFLESLNCWFLNLTPFLPHVLLPATPSGEASRLIKGQVILYSTRASVTQSREGVDVGTITGSVKGEQEGPCEVGPQRQKAPGNYTAPKNIHTHATSTQPTIKWNHMN